MQIEGRISTDPFMTHDTPHPKFKCLVILLESVGKDYIYVASQSVEIGGSYCFENLKDATYVIALEYETKEGVKEKQILEYELRPEEGSGEKKNEYAELDRRMQTIPNMVKAAGTPQMNLDGSDRRVLIKCIESAQTQTDGDYFKHQLSEAEYDHATLLQIRLEAL